MAKKRNVVKRIYEQGRETTLPAKNRLAGKSYSRKTRKGSGSPVAASSKKPRRSPANGPVSSQRKSRTTQPSSAKRIRYKRATPYFRTKDNFSDESSLPQSYGVTRLTLLVRDPYWIYAYWDIAPGSIDKLKRIIPRHLISGAKVVLRIYEVALVDFNGRNANFYFDIEPAEYADNWHINLLHDCGSFIGEVGLRVADGRFFALARSNCVQTPRVRYSPRSEQIWMKVSESQNARAFINAKKIPAGGLSRRLTASDALPRKKRIYISEEELREYYSRLSPSLKDIIERRLEYFYGNKAHKLFVTLEGDSDAERRQLISRIPQGYLIEKVMLGASQNVAVLKEQKEQKENAAQPGSVSSGNFAAEKARPRDFFFELNTELIVYGRTEPGASVWLKDKKIPLRKDGTFSLRFMLPDGKMPLEFKAVSCDEAGQKNINTYIERNTNND